tara:strand:- start:343 stop:672 length:330 start_codon:yes stop_codon:yes gene_type:complete
MALFHSVFIKEKNCKLTIPKFQNTGKVSSDLILYSACIENENWKIEKVACKNNDYFYQLSNSDLKNKVCKPYFSNLSLTIDRNSHCFYMLLFQFSNSHFLYMQNKVLNR